MFSPFLGCFEYQKRQWVPTAQHRESAQEIFTVAIVLIKLKVVVVLPIGLSWILAQSKDPWTFVLACSSFLKICELDGLVKILKIIYDCSLPYSFAETQLSWDPRKETTSLSVSHGRFWVYTNSVLIEFLPQLYNQPLVTWGLQFKGRKVLSFLLFSSVHSTSGWLLSPKFKRILNSRG